MFNFYPLGFLWFFPSNALGHLFTIWALYRRLRDFDQSSDTLFIISSVNLAVMSQFSQIMKVDNCCVLSVLSSGLADGLCDLFCSCC